MAASVIALVVGALVLAALLRPSVARSSAWRATATPLASIIGSGFLVVVPILRDTVWRWAPLAMLGLLALAYLIGAAIRDNIVHVEPVLADGSAERTLVSLERLSELTLVFAYFVSVAYYLVLFATFLLKPLAIGDPRAVKGIVTVALGVIGATGLWRGFKAVERLEIYAVTLKLAVIAAILAGLAFFDVKTWLAPHGFPGGDSHPVFARNALPVLLGTLIVVQGFETSRFLGATYPAQLRVATMRWAQLLAGAIYLVFFAGMLPLFGVASKADGVAAIVDMLRPVAAVLPVVVIVGALASQSSAAVADALGAGGLLHDLSGKRIDLRHTYPFIAFVSALITWNTNVFGLIALASRCFALYYALQCLVAAVSAGHRKRPWLGAGYAGLAAVCIAIVLFGAPADGG